MTRSNGCLARSAALLVVSVFLAVAARAGDVTAELKGETLVLEGDNLGADLVLSPPGTLSRGPRGGGTAVLVTPQNGTTLNGVAEAATFDPVESIKITTGDGSNVVLFQDLDVPGKLTLKGGAGADTVTSQDTSFGDDAKISTGDGGGTLTVFAGSTFAGNLAVTAGSGGDSLALEGSVNGSAKVSLGDGGNVLTGGGAVGDDLSYKGGAGADSITLSSFQVGGQAKLKLSNGGNTVTLDTTTQIGESLKLKGGSGDDQITTDGVQIGSDANLNLSAGNNTVSLTATAIGDDLIVKAKSGNDTVELLAGTQVGDQTKINTDGGTDVVP